MSRKTDHEIACPLRATEFGNKKMRQVEMRKTELGGRYSPFWGVDTSFELSQIYMSLLCEIFVCELNDFRCS